MVAVTRTIVRLCNRCFDGKLATHLGVRLGLNGKVFSGDLCDDHMELLYRDVLTWARVLEELTLEPADVDDVDEHGLAVAKESRFTAAPTAGKAIPAQQDRSLKIRSLLTQGGTVEAEAAPATVVDDPGDLTGIRQSTMQSWSFAHSARDAMDRVGVKHAQVWRVLDSYAKQVAPGRTDDTQKWSLNGLTVVVAPGNRKVITVMRTDSTGEMPAYPTASGS